MAEYSANQVQIVNPGESIVFTESPSPCRRGLIRHRDDTGSFLLSGYSPNNACRSCSCARNNSVNYLCDFGANISIPSTGTAGQPISVALTIDGTTVPASTMIVTPTAVDEYWNVSRAINLDVWRGCCETVSVRNTSNQAIQVQNANILFSRPDLYLSR